MKLREILYPALDALMYVDHLSLVINNHYDPYSGVCLFHRTRKEGDNDIHVAAIYYYNPRTAQSQWIRSRPVITTIGNHVFCA